MSDHFSPDEEPPLPARDADEREAPDEDEVAGEEEDGSPRLRDMRRSRDRPVD